MQNKYLGSVNIKKIESLGTAVSVAQGGTGATTAGDARTNLGLGSVATESTVPVAKGGTGATTASAARSNLGLTDGIVTASFTNNTSFTPAITFETPGDLSVSYSDQTGSYMIFGELVVFTASVVFTPTYTTASGRLRIELSGLPSSNYAGPASLQDHHENLTYPAGVSNVNAVMASNDVLLICVGSGVGFSGSAPIFISTTEIPSGTVQRFSVAGMYRT